jgi:hypothetical protein
MEMMGALRRFIPSKQKFFSIFVRIVACLKIEILASR